jgi:Tfp pilus assembly protein PilX
MSHLSPDQTISSKLSAARVRPKQSGFALVIALIMLLVLMTMGAGLSYIASSQSDMVSAVANKPLSIEAAETCFDNALEWLATTPGITWVNGDGQAYDLAATGKPLYGKTVLSDTVPLGQADSRSAMFKSRAGRASYNSCIVEKVASTATYGIGSEIGTANGYGGSSFTYTIRITATGNYNVAMNGGLIDKTFWQSNSSRSILEAVVQYTQ